MLQFCYQAVVDPTVVSAEVNEILKQEPKIRALYCFPTDSKRVMLTSDFKFRFGIRLGHWRRGRVGTVLKCGNCWCFPLNYETQGHSVL